MALALVLAPLSGPGSYASGHSTYWSGFIALALAFGPGSGSFARTIVPTLWLWLCSSRLIAPALLLLLFALAPALS